MRAHLFKPLWGHTGAIEEAVEQVRAAGFHGLEGPPPKEREERLRWRELFEQRGIQYIAEITTGGGYVPTAGLTPDNHIASFRKKLERSLEVAPVHITCLGGSDLWNTADTIAFFRKVLAFAADRGVSVSFETHRSRCLYHPAMAGRVLDALPDLTLTCDFSHWCVVCERLVLDELTGLLELCAQRVQHIHARVGYEQGPQVPDPRAPEYASMLEAFERWWKILWRGQRKRGFEATTVTPEFGPDGYLQCEPFTRKPAADLWEINRWMAERVTAWVAQSA